MLGYNDLIELRTTANATADVLLRNPEYDITLGDKNVIYNYQMGVACSSASTSQSSSSAMSLPTNGYRRFCWVTKLAQGTTGDIVARSGASSVPGSEPEARGGTVARQIADEWGFRPMVTALDQDKKFYFTPRRLRTRRCVPTGDYDPANFRTALDSGSSDLPRALPARWPLAVPPVNEQMARFNIGGPTFNTPRGSHYPGLHIRLEDLADGAVAPDADILAVIAPHRLDELSVFAIDQFLMRGGTVIIASSRIPLNWPTASCACRIGTADLAVAGPSRSHRGRLTGAR